MNLDINESEQDVMIRSELEMKMGDLAEQLKNIDENNS